MSILRYVAEDIRRFNALAGPSFFHLLMVLVQASGNGSYYNHDQDCDALKADIDKMQAAAGINLGKGSQTADIAQKKSGAEPSQKVRKEWLSLCSDF